MFSSCKVLSVEINPRFPISSLVQFSCTGATRMTRRSVWRREASRRRLRASRRSVSTHDRARSFFVARVVQRAPLHAFVTRHASRRRGRARQPRAHASSGCGLVVPPKTRAGRPRSPAMRSKAAQMLRKASALLTKASREVRGDHPPPAARLAPEESSEPHAEAVPTNPRRAC